MTNADLRKLIDETPGLTVKGVSIKAGIDRANLSTFINEKEVKEVGRKMRAGLQRAYPEWFKQTNIPNTDEEERNPTLYTLAESNKLHAESNIILARSHEKLVLTHERIVNLLEARLTADAPPKTQAEDTAVLKTIRDLVLKVGVDAGSWKTEAEGMKVVHKIADENAAYTKGVSRKHG